MATVPQIRIDKLVAEQGFTGALDAVLARVEAWPTSPTDPKYAIRLKLARQTVPAAVVFSAKSRELLVATRQHIEAWAGSPVGSPILAIQAVQAIVYYHNVMLADEQRLTTIASAPAADLLYHQAIVVQLLQNAKAGYRVVEAYRNTWWYSLTKLIQAIINFLQKVIDLATDVVNGIVDLAAGVGEAFGWLKWVALGLGGLWAYDKLWGKKSTS